MRNLSAFSHSGFVFFVEFVYLCRKINQIHRANEESIKILYDEPVAEYLLHYRIDIMFAEGTGTEGDDCECEDDEGGIQFTCDGPMPRMQFERPSIMPHKK